MEGTRHEKAGLVVASYAIGFVTAFILYSNITNKSDDVILSIPDASSAAAVIAAASVPAPAPQAANGVVLSYVDGVLQATIGESVHTLSFNPEVSDLKSDIADLTQGFHYGEMAYGLSLDNKFAFFCERHESDAASCAGYVYDIATDRIYPVVKNGEAVTISEKSAVEAVWTKTGLVVGSSYSANASAPWVLIDSESALDLQ